MRLTSGLLASGLFEPGYALRIPLGTSLAARRLAKKTGADLRVKESVLRPRVPLVVHLARVSDRSLDPRNVDGALKSIQDQLAREMDVNDDAKSLVQFVCAQEKGPRGYHAVRVRIVTRESTTEAA
jgi:hypothetical protein